MAARRDETGVAQITPHILDVGDVCGRYGGPIGDIGLQEGVRKLKNLTARPDINEMIAIADDWRPYRSVAANLLWRDYDE